MYPAIAPDIPVLRRGPHEVQLGIDPQDAVVLSGLSPAEITTLQRLDGSRSMRMLEADHPEIRGRLDAVIGDLLERGLVVDAARDDAGSAGSVLIDGDGSTSALIATILRERGITVHRGRTAFDEYDLATRSGREWLSGDEVALIVRVTAGALSPIDPHVETRDCLPVLLRSRTVSVGPLIRGRAPDHTGPCLRCLDLTRADHDPAWGQVLAQVHRYGEPRGTTPVSTLAASLATARILDHLCGTADDEEPPTSLEMSVSPPRVSHRSWARHPRCHRHRGDRHARDPHPDA